MNMSLQDIGLRAMYNYHVNKIIFGSECNDIKTLSRIARLQFDNNFDKNVKLYLDDGYNYPSALAKACNVDFDFNPNDLLGISYIKSIIKNNFDITPECILRTNCYHDTKSNENIVSASNIRSKMKENEDISKYLPNDVIDNLIRIDYSLFFKLLKAKIMTDDNLQNYVDVDEGIEYRLKKYVIIYYVELEG